MVKEKRILSYFLGWLVIGFIVCFIGINNTYAQVINSTFLGQNVNTTFGVSANSYKQGVSSITVDSSSALNYLVVDVCSTISNDFTITNISNQSGNVSLYKIYHNLGTCNTGSYGGALSKIYFKVNSWADAGNGNYGLIFSSRFNNTISYYGDNKILNIYTVNEFDNTSDIINNQTNELNNSINNSTNTITGSITNSQNNINSNIDNMEEAIIDSNKETQDVIKDQFNSCRPSINLAKDVVYSPGSANYWTLIKVNSINILEGETYTASVILESSSNTIAYWNNSSGVFDTQIINVKSGLHTYYLTFVAKKTINNIPILVSKYATDDNILITPSKLQIQEGDVATKYEEPNTEICTNKLDDTNDKLNQTNDKLNGIQGALTDSSLPNTSGLENSAGWLPAGPLDSVLNLPLSLFNALTTNLNKTCNPINIPLPYVNKNITLPCINTLYNQIGITSFLSWIGVIVSGLMLYTYLLKLYKWIEDRISLNETHNVDSWGGL